MLANAFGPEGAKRIAEHLRKGGGRVNKNIESLQKADPLQLSRFIQAEHPQTIALILSPSFCRPSCLAACECRRASSLRSGLANGPIGPRIS